MITAPLLSMFVIPAVYLMMRRPRERRARAELERVHAALVPDA